MAGHPSWHGCRGQRVGKLTLPAPIGSIQRYAWNRRVSEGAPVHILLDPSIAISWLLPKVGASERTKETGMSVDERAIIAAGNNADLYEAMFSSQGLGYERLPFAFVGDDQPPPYYSNLTVLSPDRTDEIVEQIKTLAERFDGAVGVKDSFCRLDLVTNGFRTLFEASWIWREAGARPVSHGWHRIEDETDLALWEAAWKLSGSPTDRRMFNAKMLRRTDISFLGRKGPGGYEAGCIANRSEDCMGLSNVFAASPATDLFEQAADAVASIDPRLPIVGYESGTSLEQARSAGFMTVGDLRILVADAATFPAHD